MSNEAKNLLSIHMRRKCIASSLAKKVHKHQAIKDFASVDEASISWSLNGVCLEPVFISINNAREIMNSNLKWVTSDMTKVTVYNIIQKIVMIHIIQRLQDITLYWIATLVCYMSINFIKVRNNIQCVSQYTMIINASYFVNPSCY